MADHSHGLLLAKQDVARRTINNLLNASFPNPQQFCCYAAKPTSVLGLVYMDRATDGYDRLFQQEPGVRITGAQINAN